MRGFYVVVRCVIDGLAFSQDDRLGGLVSNASECRDGIRDVAMCLDDDDVDVRPDLAHLTINARADPAGK